MNEPNASPPPEDCSDNQRPDSPPQYESSELFRGSRVVVIAHAGESYRLLLTRNNRLLLQK